MRKVNTEKITNVNLFDKTDLSRAEIEAAIEKVIEQVDINLEYFADKFSSPATVNNIYSIIDNVEWTNGFCSGVLWLAYEYTKDEKYRLAAEVHVESFYNRILRQTEVEHHDLGFLYSPSCVASYKLTKNCLAKKAAIMAADKLITRYQAKGKFIQAWGALDKAEDYRFIIDCLLNLPLLYWASEITHEKIYGEIANNHFETSLNYLIRDDGSCFHTFYMEYETGKPLKGVTRQGYNDSSSWARGQAWSIYGLALNYKYTRNKACEAIYHALTNYFLNRLPKDDVCYWDLIFQDGEAQLKDSSAAAIAVCGILEMQKYLPLTFCDREVHQNAASRMLKSLIENYMNDEKKPGACLLKHGVYSWHSKKGLDEGNIWGDYFYFEALMRAYKDIQIYW